MSAIIFLDNKNASIFFNSFFSDSKENLVNTLEGSKVKKILIVFENTGKKKIIKENRELNAKLILHFDMSLK